MIWDDAKLLIYVVVQISPVVGILTRQDLRAHNILGAFPHLANKRGEEGRSKKGEVGKSAESCVGRK